MSVIEQAAELIRSARYLTAFTGAGVSAESGIPTFRDKGGIWEKFSPEDVGTPQGLMANLMRNPQIVIDMIESLITTTELAEPNPGHMALASLERTGLLKVVITQNVDNLHQEAGNEKVIEVHGNLMRLRCLSCGRKTQLSKSEFLKFAKEFKEELKEKLSGGIQAVLEILPKCLECHGFQRPDVVLFTEPVQDLDRAFKEAEMSDVMIVAGTSGVVYPAAYVPNVAKRAGAKIMEINPTGCYFEGITDIWIDNAFAKTMPQIIELVLS